ncbi:MAG: serine hydrolase [Candidatus Aminicenantes bacterium]|nr:serine hydrolase [Candidatus Aminicenantes bacterium]
MSKIFRYIQVLFLAVLLLSSVQGQERVAESQELNQDTINRQGPTDPDELESFLDGIMAVHLESYHIAGATLSVVKDGKILLAKGYGYADIKNKKPVNPEKTLFRPGSVSKLFTWTAVMQLFEQGKLDLEADVNQYLKDFKIPDTYPEPITLTHLFTHTPGFEDVWTGMAARSAEDLVPLGEFLAERMPPRFLPPGKLAAYSNYGTALAGYIVQELSGIPFEEYIEENIFKPLGMEQSSFRQPLPPRLAGDMSVGYTFVKGKYEARGFEFINGLAPAGSLSSSATDMAKFMIAHLQLGKYGEQSILEEETAIMMQRQLFTHDPRLDGNAYGFWEQSLNNLRMIGHGGDSTLFHTSLVLIPERNLGFYISYNSTGGAGAARDELLQAFLDRYYPMPEELEPEPSPDFLERAGRFTGYYGMARGVFSTYEKIANLMMVIQVKTTEEGTLLTPFPAGLGIKQWVEVEPLVFRELGGQGILVFQENDQGRIANAFVNQFPYFALVKLAWYQSPGFHYTLLAILMILFLSTLGWPLSALSRLVCRRKKDIRSAPWFVRGVAGTISAFYIIFLLGTVMALSDPMEIMFGIPSLLKIALIFPLISAGLTVVALILTYFVWKNRYWTVCGRAQYTLIILASAVFLWFLNYWKLFGFNF